MTEESSPPLIERQTADTDVGCRLDVFLARQPEVESRVVAKRLIQEGHVTVDGLPCKPGLSLVENQRVEFRVVDAEPGPAPPSVEWELGVLHEDAVLIVINKPAGLAVHSPGKGRGHDQYVTTLAVRRWGNLPVVAGADRPGIVHRLDKDTSGVMAMARTDEAFHFIQSQFKARTVRKEYHALCYGDVRFDSDYIEGNIGVDAQRGDRMALVKEGGREASTYYEVIERFGDITYVRCRPRTGRTHQIRVHMASIGHPLVGDRLYRGRRVDQIPADAPDPGRHCLHAWSLALQHPRTHEELWFDAPLPPDMTALLRWLQRRAEA